MIIGLDLTWMTPINKCGGIFQYGMRLVDALVCNTCNTIVAIGSEESDYLFQDLAKHDNFKFIAKTSSSFMTPIVEQERIDVIHTPIQNHINYTLAVPMINTLHDLQHYYFPEFFTPEEIEFRNVHYKRSVEFSTRVVVSYQHVKDDLVKFFKIPPEKIDICGHGMANIEKKVLPSQIDALKRKYDLPAKYILYSANTWRHKNHIGLLRALKILHSKYGLNVPLICTGIQYPDFFPNIKEEASRLGLSNNVRFLGYLPEEEMPAILSGATLSVIPTLYEAGSFPLMEAMNLGVPVICSMATSLPDTIGDMRFVFDATLPNDIADKIAMMLSNQQLREANIANSAARAKKWRWDQAVKPFEESYQRAIESFDKIKKYRWYSDWALNYEFMAARAESKLRRELAIYSDELARTRHDLNYSVKKVEDVQRSLSWRITAPLRKALYLLKRLINNW